MDRRDFVKGAAGMAISGVMGGVVGSAAANVLAAPARALNRRQSPNEQLSLAMIGMGIRGRNIFNGYLRDNPRARVVAIAEVDTNRRDHYKSHIDSTYSNSNCDAYLDYHDVLTRDDIDAVIITTPDHWHATQALAAMAAGKDVYCEKPLTHTLHEGKALIDAARKHGTVFQTGSQQRSEYDYKFCRAVDLIRNGRIGKVLNVNVGVADPAFPCDLPAEDMEPGLDWDRWLGPAPMRAYNAKLSPRGVHGHYPEWRWYSEYGNGYLADMGAHHYDIAHWALRMDESGPVEASPPRDGDKKRGATLVYPTGVTITHGGPSGTTFIGTNGMIHVDRGRLVSVPGDIVDADLPDNAELQPRPKNHMENWLDCIESRNRPVADVEIGARTAAACQLLNLAYRTHRTIKWDPKAWRFTNPSDTGMMDYERRKGYELGV